MVSLAEIKSDAKAQIDFVSKTPFAFYRIDGTAAPGAPFTIHGRGSPRLGFGSSSTQITLPGAGTYALQLFDSVWSDGTANPQAITIDVYDDGALAGSFSVDRPSADPGVGIELASPFLFAEGNFALSGGPLEFRNGSSSNQRAALALRLWQSPEPYSRPDPLAFYWRTWVTRTFQGKPYHLRGAYEIQKDANGDDILVPITSNLCAQVPFGPPAKSEPGLLAGSYQVQVTGSLKNLSSAAKTLAIELYSGETLLHSESIAASGSQTVDVAVDETLAFAGGRFDIRNGLADEIDEGETVNYQAADLLVKVWGPL